MPRSTARRLDSAPPRHMEIDAALSSPPKLPAKPPVFPAPKAKAKAAKPAKAKAKPAPQHAEPNFAPLDPLSSTLIPISRRQASAFPYMGMVKLDVDVITTRALYVLTNTGHGATIIGGMTAAPWAGAWNISAISSSPASGGPSSGRAMKCSLEITNNTAQMTAGGRVYVLKTSQRLAAAAAPSGMTTAQMNAMFDSIRDHPEVKPYDGVDFKKTDKHGRHPTFVCDVVDGVDYENFRPWQGSESSDAFFSHVLTWSGMDASSHERPMSTVFVLIEVPDNKQVYTLSARGSFYTRWPLTTVPGQTQFDIPVASLDRINQLTTAAPDGLGAM